MNFSRGKSYGLQTSVSEDLIRKEAASQAINKTIRLVEQRLGIQIIRVGTPTENRDEMIDTLRDMLRN